MYDLLLILRHLFPRLPPNVERRRHTARSARPLVEEIWHGAEFKHSAHQLRC